MKEHLDFRFEAKALRQEGTFEGYASVFEVVDDQRDRVAPGAFRRSLESHGPQGIKLLWQHDARQPIGVWEDVREDEKGLYVKGRLLLEVQRAREAYALLKAGALDGLSIGYSTIEASFDERSGVRRITEVDLWEVSLVTFPANMQARVGAVKAVVPFQDLPLAARDRVWGRAAAERRVRAWAGADEDPNPRYRRAFVWYDSGKPDNFSSYKLPIADVIGATLTAVPRAIFAAAAAIEGARGGVDIPDGERPGVRRHLARYYRKMDLDPPWERSGPTVREIETALREAGLSRQEAVLAASAAWKALSQRDADGGGLTELVASLKRATEVLNIR